MVAWLAVSWAGCLPVLLIYVKIPLLCCRFVLGSSSLLSALSSWSLACCMSGLPLAVRCALLRRVSPVLAVGCGSYLSIFRNNINT